MTRVADTSVIKMTPKSGFSGRTFALVRSNTVVTSAAVVTESNCAIVDVHAAIVTCPAVDTDAHETAGLVMTCAGVLARRSTHLGAFVDVLRAVSPCPLRRTLARVSLDSIDARRTVRTQVVLAVINILLTVESGKTRDASTLVRDTSCNNTRAPIQTRTW